MITVYGIDIVCAENNKKKFLGFWRPVCTTLHGPTCFDKKKYMVDNVLNFSFFCVSCTLVLRPFSFMFTYLLFLFRNSRHSFDVVSAESAMRLFTSAEGGYDEEGEGKGAIGLTDRRKYNGFVPLMDEGDPLKTAVMTVFSGLQVCAC